MKQEIIQIVCDQLDTELSLNQLKKLNDVLNATLFYYDLIQKKDYQKVVGNEDNLNNNYLEMYTSSKKIEGCSAQTIIYYEATLKQFFKYNHKSILDVNTEDIRAYLAKYQNDNKVSKVTLDNVRRIFSSFFTWMENEDYITKSPVRRIHKVKEDKIIKTTFTDENIEILRDKCPNIRDLALVDLLNSTGMRVGELVKLNISDMDFNNRECIVFGKGNKERVVYFDAKTKVHLSDYLKTRTDENTALFVSNKYPYNRLKIGGVQCCLRRLGGTSRVKGVHPHKFRRTLATSAIEKGMPIEQVQKLLGHAKIDTTMHYAIVNQNNVKLAHKKYIG